MVVGETVLWRPLRERRAGLPTGSPSRLPWSEISHWSGIACRTRRLATGHIADEDEDEKAFGRVCVRACCGADGEVGSDDGARTWA